MSFACLLITFNQKVIAKPSSPDVIEVCTEYTYYAPPNITEEEAKYNALKRARLQAIEEHFGSIVNQNNSTTVIAEGGKSDVSFISHSSSEVSGEWIETIGKPVYNIWYDGSLIVKVKVKGLIRSISKNDTDLDVKILCNGTSEKFERTSFRDGDDIFLQFLSPVDGYIAVYLSDLQNVYCLLPYPDDIGHAMFVKGGEKRILFSYDHRNGQEAVKQYHMTCDKEFDTNVLYIFFSKNPFDKAIDYSENQFLPRILSSDDFYKWMSKCKRKDKFFQVKEFNISITK